MKRLVIIVLPTLALVLAITLAVNWLYIHKRPEREVDKFKDVPYGIEVCNLGSSHGKYGFDYSYINKTTFNFALGSQMPTYDLRVLKSYIDHLSEEAVVFIPVSYFSLFGLSEEDRSEFDSKNKRYYEFLPYENIKKADKVTKLFVAYLPALTANEELFTVLFGKDAKEDTLKENSIDKDNAVSSVYSRYKAHIVSDKFDENGIRIINNQEVCAIYEIIDLCRNNRAIPVLITTPFLEEYVNEIKTNDPDFFNDFYREIDDIVKRTGVIYCDYSMDERFSRNYDLFFDVDHLNRNGARLFTRIVLDDLESKLNNSSTA